MSRPLALSLALLAATDASAGTVTVEVTESVYSSWILLEPDFSDATATGGMGPSDWYEEAGVNSALTITSTSGYDRSAWSGLYDLYDAPPGVYDGTDDYSVGVAHAGSDVSVSWSAGFQTGALQLDAEVVGELDTSWLDYQAAVAIGDIYPAYPPVPAYRVPAQVTLKGNAIASFATLFTLDAPATLTLQWEAGAETDYFVFRAGASDLARSLDGDGTETIALGVGTHVLSVYTVLDEEHTEADGAGAFATRGGVDATWTIQFADDADSDGILDADDNCVAVANAGQADLDEDGAGDACDACPNDALDDGDGDGVCGDVDVCPDGDDQLDADADATPDDCDACPADADNDADGDGICADADVCPSGDDEADADADATPDACDACPDDDANDVDGDGVCGDIDTCPGVADSNQSDLDLDGIGDACEPDTDGDAVWDDLDNCTLVPNSDQADLDADGTGDACELDSDDDGVNDSDDACPDTELGAVVDATGCALDQLVPCASAWKNHGAYVSALAKAAQRFVTLGLISETEKGEIVSDGASSTCGR